MFGLVFELLMFDHYLCLFFYFPPSTSIIIKLSMSMAFISAGGADSLNKFLPLPLF